MSNEEISQGWAKIIVDQRDPSLREPLLKIKVLQSYDQNAKALATFDVKSLVEALKFLTDDTTAAEGMNKEGIIYSILTENSSLLPFNCDKWKHIVEQKIGSFQKLSY